MLGTAHPILESAKAGLAAAFVVLASGSFANELQLPPDLIQNGELLYNQKCRACHGKDGAGGSGPSVTGILPKHVTSSSKGIENMPSVALRDGDAEAIGAFLMSLAPDEARKRLDLLK